MNKTVISIVNTLIFCFWNSGDLRAEETDVKSLPPIQFAEGEKRFTAVNQKRVDIVKQIPGLVALWDFVQRRDSWKTEQWVKEIQLSGTFRLRGKGFASLVTPEGNFWVEEGKFSSGYKLIELDISQSQPSALIQKGDRQAWIGLRLGMSNPVKREIARQKLERRGGVLGLLYVKGETEPFTGTAFLSFANGSKSEVTPYVDGKINGTEINYYANGSKYGVTPFVNGQKDGKQIWYNENGSKSAEYVFENGKEISRREL